MTIGIAITALVLSLASFLWNWRHSESLFRRQEYPAVPWQVPKVTRRGDNTSITTSIRNCGPRDITHVFLTAFLCRGLTVKAWCKSEIIEAIKTDEPLDFTLTEEFEKDIQERFRELVYKNGWRFQDKPRRYKIIINLKYQPMIADTNPVTRKTYCLLTPVVENNTIKEWQLEWIPNLKRCLPHF